MNESKHSVAFVIGWKPALVILFVILAAFAVGGWRLTEIQHDYTRKIASAARVSAKDYANQIAHAALKLSCDTGNSFRSFDQRRWNGVVGLFGTPRDPRFKDFVDRLNALTVQADKQRDCSKL